MSRKGDRWHNAPRESFFHTLKTERVHHRLYATRDQSRRDLFHSIGASTIHAHCTQPWATSAQPTPSVERLNPVHFFGGGSASCAAKARTRTYWNKLKGLMPCIGRRACGTRGFETVSFAKSATQRSESRAPSHLQPPYGSLSSGHWSLVQAGSAPVAALLCCRHLAR
jgi:hypothetical protein